ncbi:MAG: SGNH/GDSL hydrolase family protein [Prevotella sp.]|nr:SGNH/GDSL hydrolase family protein [Staphylococcus sp.]MCM1350632.1 SGNH/GDSL hydrolase family protein [Prevotella sp.]
MNLDKNFDIPLTPIVGTKWIDPLTADVQFYGLNWIQEEHLYQRLSRKWEEEIGKVSPKVVALSKHTAGGQLHFITNSSCLVIHAKVHHMAGISGMTFVAQGGFDCYVGKDYDSLMFYDSSRFAVGMQEYEYTLFKDLKQEERLIVLNFPLYGGVEHIEIAIDEGAYIHKPLENFSNHDKIVYYGTSITQGGCASRPGLCYTNLLSRAMKAEIINFGFSGNAFGEAVVAEMMASIENASMFVLDYEANGGTNGKLEATLENMIQIIRMHYPNKPIVVISRIKYLFDDLNPDTLGKKREKIRLFQQQLVQRLSKKDHHIYYINGAKLLGDDYHEYTVDSIHPNDLGFKKMASHLEKEFKKIMKKEDEKKNESIIK